MCVCILYISLNTGLLVTVGIYTIRTYCNVAAIYSLVGVVGVVGVVGNGYKPV